MKLFTPSLFHPKQLTAIYNPVDATLATLPSGSGLILPSFLLKDIVTLNIVLVKLPIDRLLHLVSVPCPILS